MRPTGRRRSSSATRLADVLPGDGCAEALSRASRPRSPASRARSSGSAALRHRLPDRRRARSARAATRSRRDARDPRHRRANARCSARSRSSACSSTPCSRSSASACASPTRTAGCSPSTAPRTPPSLHPLEWAEALRPAAPRRDRVRPARDAAAARAARRGGARRRARVEAPVGGRALAETAGPSSARTASSLGAVVVNADLTDFRDAEGRLRRSEERHRRVVESVGRLRLRDRRRRAAGRTSRDAWTTATGFDRRGVARAPGVGVRAPRRPRRARARLRAADGRRARRAAPRAPLS